jgi:hypothetical protein
MPKLLRRGKHAVLRVSASGRCDILAPEEPKRAEVSVLCFVVPGCLIGQDESALVLALMSSARCAPCNTRTSGAITRSYRFAQTKPVLLFFAGNSAADKYISE